jgi:hypothetical protein
MTSHDAPRIECVRVGHSSRGLTLLRRKEWRGGRCSNQQQALHAGMALFADDDVIVDGNAKPGR